MNDDELIKQQTINAIFELTEKYKHIGYFNVKFNNDVVEFLIDGKAVININTSGMVPYIIVVGSNFLLGGKVNIAFYCLSDLLKKLKEIYN